VDNCVKYTNSKLTANKVSVVEYAEPDLLNLFFSLPLRQRELNFASTARAAEIVGLSQRTIQFWAQIGVIQSIRIGNKYQIYLRSLMQEQAQYSRQNW